MSAVAVVTIGSVRPSAPTRIRSSRTRSTMVSRSTGRSAEYATSADTDDMPGRAHVGRRMRTDANELRQRNAADEGAIRHRRAVAEAHAPSDRVELDGTVIQVDRRAPLRERLTDGPVAGGADRIAEIHVRAD